MTTILSFIGLSLLFYVLSCALGFLPFVAFMIMVEMAGDGSYLGALTLNIASFVNIIIFLFYPFGGEIDFHEMLNRIKSIFKRNKLEKKEKAKSDRIPIFSTSAIIELVILAIFIIYGIFAPQHSIFFDLSYTGILQKILFVLFIPLTVINIINNKMETGSFGILGFTTIPSLFALTIAIILLATANMSFPDIRTKIISGYTYDNNEFDDIRKEKNITDSFEYLKSSYIAKLDELAGTYDINNEDDYNKIKEEIVGYEGCEECGFELKDHCYADNDTVLLAIADYKTAVRGYYKLNFKTHEFTLSSADEFKEMRKNK